MRNRYSERMFWPVQDGPGLLKYFESSTSYSSPRVNGRLMLRQLPYTKFVTENLSYKVFGLNPAGAIEAPSTGWVTYDSVPGGARAMASADNQARARFFGTLRKGGGSLGITLAKYAQSRNMIAKASERFSNWNTHVADTLQGRKRYWKNRLRLIPNWHLEFIFGWVPVYKDVWAAANTIIQMAPTHERVRGSGTGYYRYHDVQIDPNARPRNGPRSIESWHGTNRSTVVGDVLVDNPNLWLANRAGLLNPATVAWDAIPWSFLVNKFVNMNALLNQLTDEVGLSISDISVTRHGSIVATSQRAMTWLETSDPNWGLSVSEWRSRTTNRSLGEIPSPSAELRLPSVDLAGATMLFSLAVQQMVGLSFIKPFFRK